MVKPMKLERGKVYFFNVRHDDDCRIWQSDNPSDCSCDPDIEPPIEVNEDNQGERQLPESG